MQDRLNLAQVPFNASVIPGTRTPLERTAYANSPPWDDYDNTQLHYDSGREIKRMHVDEDSVALSCFPIISQCILHHVISCAASAAVDIEYTNPLPSILSYFRNI